MRILLMECFSPPFNYKMSVGMLEMALRAGRQGWKDLWPFMPLVGNECQQELASMFA